MKSQTFEKYLRQAMDDLKRDFGTSAIPYPSVIVKQPCDMPFILGQRERACAFANPGANTVTVSDETRPAYMRIVSYHEGAHILHFRRYGGTETAPFLQEFVAEYAACVPRNLQTYRKSSAASSVRKLLSQEFVSLPIFDAEREGRRYDMSHILARALYRLYGRSKLSEFSSVDGVGKLFEILKPLVPLIAGKKRVPTEKDLTGTRVTPIDVPLDVLLEPYRCG